MARTQKVEVNGQEFTLQSVTPKWYFEQNDKCGMTGNQKDTGRYMDIMFKNVVVNPTNISQKGLDAFEDVETPELLIREIEKFLRPGKPQSDSTTKGGSK